MPEMEILTVSLPVPEAAIRAFCKSLSRIDSTAFNRTDLQSNNTSVIDKLVRTGYDPSIGVAHRGVAINAICSFVGHIRRLTPEAPLTEDLWFRCNDILLDRRDGAKSKPLRQLLLCITDLLSTFSTDQRISIIDRTVKDVVQILLRQSDHVKAKPALHILGHFIEKDIITLESLRTFSPGHAIEGNTENVQWLVELLLGWVAYQDTAIAACQTTRIVIRKLDKRASDTRALLWTNPLRKVMRLQVDDLNNFRSHLLPYLAKEDTEGFFHLLALVGMRDDVTADGFSYVIDVRDEFDTTILFTCLEVGKEAGIVIEGQNDKLTREGSILHIPEIVLVRIIESNEDTMRLAGLSLIISTVSATRPFSPFVLQCMRQSFSHLFMEPDVYARGEVLVRFQRLVDRIKAAMGPLQKAVAKEATATVAGSPKSKAAEPSGRAESLIRQHRQFLRSILDLVQAQLHPSASYQRHTAGLKVLTILAKSGLDARLPRSQLSKQAQAKEAAIWPFSETIFDIGLSRLLQDLLMDPFEDVRAAASALLVMTVTIPECADGTRFAKLTKRAEALMLASGRADHADGVSRATAIVFEAANDLRYSPEDSAKSQQHMIENLINRVEQRILLARENMQLAVRQYPLHGALASLRLIFDDQQFYFNIQKQESAVWHNLHDRIIATLHSVWLTVHDVLCNDAPEGYVPDDMEEQSAITTKDILSYCWRALKEASSFSRVLAQRAPIGDDGNALLSTNDFQNLCELIFRQLVELRHRGAFSAVAQAFFACCSRMNTLRRRDVLEKLFQNALTAIQDKGSATTRRSAGLPSIIVGILGASPASALLERGIMALVKEAEVATAVGARHGDSLPQVHALNCLRAVFINTTLGQHTEPYIATCLTLAGKCLTNEIWAIRNCGLMLFRALIDRLLGSADSQNWTEDLDSAANARISYDDFPDLFDIVLRLLTTDTAQLNSAQSALESVFPALKLVQRIPPPSARRSEVKNLVSRLCGSPHWHVRDMAARTYALLTPNSDRVEDASMSVPNLSTGQNMLHGHLLCISWLLRLHRRSGDSDMESLQSQERVLHEADERLFSNCSSPYTRALYLDIMNMLGIRLLYHGSIVASNCPPSGKDMTAILQQVPAMQTPLAMNLLLAYLGRASQSTQAIVPMQSGDDCPDLESYLLWLHSELPNTALQVLEGCIDFLEPIHVTVMRTVAKHLSLFAGYCHDCDFQQLAKTRSLLVQVYLHIKDDAIDFSPDLTFDDTRFTFASTRTPPPALVESTVQLWGIMVNRACIAEIEMAPVVISTMTELVPILRVMIEDTQPFDLRIAAARSLQHMPKIWSLRLQNHSVKEQLEAMRLDISLVVYDLLNDDDDEIREIAVEVATTILSHHIPNTQRVVPLLASQRLLVRMTTHYAYLPQFFEEAVLRTTGLKDHDSAATAFAAASASNTALFAVEKQNLFVDPVRETILWSQALKHIPLNTMFPSRSSSAVTQSLTKWTREALSLMKGKLTSESGEDGVLGWTSKPDMFVFGMRLWYVVDVAFERRRKIERRSDRLLGKIVEIFDLGKKRDVHPLWLKKMEKVIARELRHRMSISEVEMRVRGLQAVVTTM